MTAEAAEATAPSTFTCFSRLPTELRLQIWRDSLPAGRDPPALAFYKEGCWRPRMLTASDEGYEEDDLLNLCLEYRHEALDRVEVKLPQASVNQESRGVALEWAREQDLEVCQSTQGHHDLVVARPYDPERDALYVPPDKWTAFCQECALRHFEPDLAGAILQVVDAAVTSIVVHAATFTHDDSQTAAYMDGFSNFRVLYYVADVPEDLRNGGKAEGVEPRWELRSAPGPEYSWSDEDNRFKRVDSYDDHDPNLRQKIGDFLYEVNAFEFPTNTSIKEVKPAVLVRI